MTIFVPIMSNLSTPMERIEKLKDKGMGKFKTIFYCLSQKIPVKIFICIKKASRSGVAIELNAHPYRLDIDWRLCKYAKEK